MQKEQGSKQNLEDESEDDTVWVICDSYFETNRLLLSFQLPREIMWTEPSPMSCEYWERLSGSQAHLMVSGEQQVHILTVGSSHSIEET